MTSDWKGKRVHFIGIGGIGVSSLARWFLSQGATISGSDGSPSDLIAELRKEGMRIAIGHAGRHLPSSADLVVFSQAIREENPELSEARRRGIKILSYPQMVGRLTEEHDTIAVAGAHGKSTTTAMLGLVLARARKNPTVIVGTKLKEFGNSNFRRGGKLLVLEADEYKRAFLNYSPFIAIVTNIDREHLEIYGSFSSIKKTFLKFLNRVRKGGMLILNRDDAPLRALLPHIKKISKKTGVRVAWYSLREPLAGSVRKHLSVPGRHNLSNALAAAHAAAFLGAKRVDVLRSLGAYRGAWRRMEYRGRLGRTARLYDDYAHHPTEIKATLGAFRAKYPDKRILCVFQPHQAERLARLFGDFETAFKAADETLILPEYRVPGRDTISERYTSEALVKRIQKRSPRARVFYLKETGRLADAVRMLGPLDGKIIIMMGAGPIVELTGGLLAKPASFWKKRPGSAC